MLALTHIPLTEDTAGHYEHESPWLSTTTRSPDSRIHMTIRLIAGIISMAGQSQRFLAISLLTL
jgi:hypothetical protein